MKAILETARSKNVHVPQTNKRPIHLLEEKKAALKIAYIGGGSREWAAKLMVDLALSPHLEGSLALFDIDHDAARENENLGAEVFSHPSARTRFHVHATGSIDDALAGADFVVISIEPGPVALRKADVEIPWRYGILQTVGDTTGPGGLCRALRSVPMFQGFARKIRERCPSAWVINYTNPMALCTAALLTEEPKLKVFGCCHEVFGTQMMLARLVRDNWEVPEPPRQEIRLEISGVNHFTWALSANWKGRDLFPLLRQHVSGKEFFKDRSEDAGRARSQQRWFDHHGLVAYDLFRRFGVLGAAGDRHLAEFVPWYLTSEQELHRWGVVATPISWRMQRLRKSRQAPDKNSALKPSGEEGVAQMEALLGFGDLVTNVNLPNRGQVPEAEAGRIVETNALISKNEIRPICAAAHPPGSGELIRRALTQQRLALDAALLKDSDLALQALMLDPLVDLPLCQLKTMLEEMLEATAGQLPGWDT
jgi:alpha-galactosidase/6-phospho-beta-glucosidase family protein